MEKTDDGLMDGPRYAGALGGLDGAGRRVKICILCGRAILDFLGQGYNVIPGRGNTHSKCLDAWEDADACQGQADGGGDRGGVCPEG